MTDAELWDEVYTIAPHLTDEAESLMSADKDDLPGIADTIMALALRLDNIVSREIVMPRAALAELRS